MANGYANVLRTAVVIAGVLHAQASAEPKPADRDWRKIAARDLVAMRDDLKQNSPFMVVKRDSAKPRAWLDAGYRIARQRLVKVRDAQSAYWLLKGYAGGFRDAHISLSQTDKLQGFSVTRAWPGFSTAWRSGGYVVSYADPSQVGLPPLGARLLQCDGKNAEALARKRLDLFEGNLDLYGRLDSAFALLWDRSNPFAGPPLRRCTFSINGKNRVYALAHAEGDASTRQKAHDASISLAQSGLTVTKWHDGWWIGAPNFYVPEWPKYLQEIERHKAELRAAPYVIVDARGNGGGNSDYADQLAAILWGKDFADAHAPDLGPVVYRATVANRDSYRSYLKQAEANKNEEWAADLRKKLNLFEQALAAHRPTFTIDQPSPDRANPAPNPMRGKVIVLTDPICTSACLDMLDLFTRMPNVVQAGTMTNADTIFMDISTLDLPSGYFRLGYGHKAWIKRPRGSNVPYRPSQAWMYNGDLASDSGWRDWLLSKIR